MTISLILWVLNNIDIFFTLAKTARPTLAVGVFPLFLKEELGPLLH